MIISSRTPEGTPNHCAICGYDLILEPSKTTLDAPCPYCGHLLWFASEQPATPLELAALVLELGAARFGPPTPCTRLEIEAIVDPDRLNAIFEKVPHCTSWEDLVLEI